MNKNVHHFLADHDGFKHILVYIEIFICLMNYEKTYKNIKDVL